MARPTVNTPYTFNELRWLLAEQIHQKVKADTLYEWTVQALVRGRHERKATYSYRDKQMVAMFALGMKRYNNYEAARNFMLQDLKKNPKRYIEDDQQLQYTVEDPRYSSWFDGQRNAAA